MPDNRSGGLYCEPSTNRLQIITKEVHTESKAASPCSVMRCGVGGRRGKKKPDCVEVCPALSVGTLTHAFRAEVSRVGWTAAEQRPAAALQQRLKPSNHCFIMIIYWRCNMLPDQEAGEGFRPRHSALHLIPPSPPHTPPSSSSYSSALYPSFRSNCFLLSPPSLPRRNPPCCLNIKWRKRVR